MYFDKYISKNSNEWSHMCFFSGKIQKLNILCKELPNFWEKYIEFLNKHGSDKVCITEKACNVFQFFIDLDFTSDINLNQVVDVLDIIKDKVYNSFGVEYECIYAMKNDSRKMHLYFKGLYLDKEYSKVLVSSMTGELMNKLDWFKREFLDSSVYSTGLRILGCSKNGMQKKNVDNSIYLIGNLEKSESGEMTVNLLPLSWNHLADTSIISNNMECMEFTSTSTITSTSTNKRQKTGKESSEITTSQQTIQDLDNDIIELVTEYLSSLNVHGIDFTSTSIKKISSDCIKIDIVPQKCPLKGEKHKRTSDRNVSANYIILTTFDSTLYCWKCKDDTIHLPLPRRELFELLQGNSPNYLLKSSLYKQTHETISEYIFSIVKDTFAASQSTSSSYLWYYYQADKHRWIKGEKIITYIMNPNNKIQQNYQEFINIQVSELSKNGSSDSEGDSPDTSNIFKTLWKKLQMSLQTTPFVKGGLLPLLARKLQDYWEKIGNLEHPNFQSKLDQNPSLLGFTNGVYSFKDSIFRPGHPKDLISMSTCTEYTPWKDINSNIKDEMDDFLSKIFVEKLHKRYFLEQLSMALHGVSYDQNFFILTGAGANGKSTIVRLLNEALGEYAGEVNVTLFTHPRPPANQPCPELIQIKGKRFVTCSEPNGRESFNLSTVKWLTGGDRITAAAKFESNQSFYLQCTFFLLTNDIPQINAGAHDFGTWRRMKPITFDSCFKHANSFETNTSKNIFPVDPTIYKKIDIWKNAFISLLVDISCEIKDTLPQKMPKEFYMLWRELQNKNDLYTRFYKEYITKDEESFKDSNSVFQHFEIWRKGIKMNKSVQYDTFEKHMLHLIGPLQKNSNGLSGWNIDIRAIPFHFS
jgi:P4 family phage/plasmid primase-like protien